MGLYLGLSILSVIEFLELFADFALVSAYKALRCCTKRNNRVGSTATLMMSESITRTSPEPDARPKRTNAAADRRNSRRHVMTSSIATRGDRRRRRVSRVDSGRRYVKSSTSSA